jgi:hypothetical protein
MLECLRDIGVIEARRIVHKNQTGDSTSKNVILVFGTDAVPRSVRLGFTQHAVEKLPNVKYCYGCLSLDHLIGKCPKTADTCAKCGIEGHIKKNCNAQEPRCSNCGGPHQARAFSCPNRKEVEDTERKKALDRHNSRNIGRGPTCIPLVTPAYPNIDTTTMSGRSYSSVVSGGIRIETTTSNKTTDPNKQNATGALDFQQFLERIDETIEKKMNEQLASRIIPQLEEITDRIITKVMEAVESRLRSWETEMPAPQSHYVPTQSHYAFTPQISYDALSTNQSNQISAESNGTRAAPTMQMPPLNNVPHYGYPYTQQVLIPQYQGQGQHVTYINSGEYAQGSSILVPHRTAPSSIEDNITSDHILNPGCKSV